MNNVTLVQNRLVCILALIKRAFHRVFRPRWKRKGRKRTLIILQLVHIYSNKRCLLKKDQQLFTLRCWPWIKANKYVGINKIEQDVCVWNNLIYVHTLKKSLDCTLQKNFNVKEKACTVHLFNLMAARRKVLQLCSSLHWGCSSLELKELLRSSSVVQGLRVALDLMGTFVV